MTLELIFGAGLLLVMVISLIAWRAQFNVWEAWMRHLDEAKLRKQIELESLDGYYKRLKNLTSDLLAKANEMDQESKLLHRELSKDWSRTLGTTCSQLVTLADQTKMIERYLDKREPRAVRQLLSTSCTLAGKTVKQLRWLRISAQKKGIELTRITQVQSDRRPSSN
jgi:FKBP-type peptidyl-prolyl cis-trans isomerase (trigger factor)